MHASTVLRRLAWRPGGSCVVVGHGAERDGVARRVDGWDAVIPDAAGFASHHVEGTRFGLEREPLPGTSGLASKAKFAGRRKRQSKDLVEVRLIAVPADPGPFSYSVNSTCRMEAAGRPANACTFTIKGAIQAGRSSACSSLCWS